jgi:hypothetical protein
MNQALSEIIPRLTWALAGAVGLIPLGIEIALGAPEVAGLSPEALAQLNLYYADDAGGAWTRAPAIYDQGALKLSGSLSHLSHFAVASGKASAVYLPVLRRSGR